MKKKITPNCWCDDCGELIEVDNVIDEQEKQWCNVCIRKRILGKHGVD